MAEPKTVSIPRDVYRVGRADNPLGMSWIRPDDAVLPTAGNRYDVAGGGVLYASTQLEACFGETVSRFRPTPKMRALLAHEESGFMLCGGIPRDWRLRRVIVKIATDDPLPFLDVDDLETQEALTVELGPTMVGLGYNGPIDLSVLRNSDRRLSRAIALWAYTKTDDEGQFLYSGIRYASRLNDDWENWAIFDGTELFENGRWSIGVNEGALRSVARTWDLTVH